MRHSPLSGTFNAPCSCEQRREDIGLPLFGAMYAECGRELLRAQWLQMLNSVHSERLLMEMSTTALTTVDFHMIQWAARPDFALRVQPG